MPYTLRIENLCATTTEQDLLSLFGAFGSVGGADVADDPCIGNGIRCGTVTMASDRQARVAAAKLDGEERDGLVLSVFRPRQTAQPREHAEALVGDRPLPLDRTGPRRGDFGDRGGIGPGESTTLHRGS